MVAMHEIGHAATWLHADAIFDRKTAIYPNDNADQVEET